MNSASLCSCFEELNELRTKKYWGVTPHELECWSGCSQGVTLIFCGFTEVEIGSKWFFGRTPD